MKNNKILKMVGEYFYWLDAEKRHPSCGFAEPRRNAEKILRERVKNPRVLKRFVKQ